MKNKLKGLEGGTVG